MEAVEAAEGHIEPLASIVRNDPHLAAAALVAIIAFLMGVRLLIKRWRRPPGERFARLVGGVESLAVLMHPNPDPDAMACALAVKELAEHRGTDVTMYYPGQIRHHENRAFETVLDVDLERVEQVPDIEEEHVVLVDHNEPRGFQGAKSIDPIAVIDHHPQDGSGLEFTDIRTEYGACSTIFAEYFQELGWDPVDSNGSNGDDDAKTMSSRVVNGLTYGIHCDTNHLTKGCSPNDFRAIEYLYEGVDQEKLDRIANPDMDAESIHVKVKALTEHTSRQPFAVSDVGEVSNIDSIPQAADELRRVEGFNAVVVMGEKDDELHFSGRSNDDRVHIGKVLERAVDGIPLAEAGGHARMGGGRCLIEYMEGHDEDEEPRVTREEFKERLFTEMNGGD